MVPVYVGQSLLKVKKTIVLEVDLVNVVAVVTCLEELRLVTRNGSAGDLVFSIAVDVDDDFVACVTIGLDEDVDFDDDVDFNEDVDFAEVAVFD